jgi:hypothetical protein
MRTVRKLGAVAMVVLALLSGCTSGTQAACAGQCHAPYELDVFFHPGVSPTRAVQLLKECEHLPGVLRVGWDGAASLGVVYTTFFGPNSPSQGASLFSCLKRLRLGSAWPD